jgi:hypothetical protein
MTSRSSRREMLQSLGATALATFITLLCLEALLRVVDFRELRETASERALTYKYDPELGWTPRENSQAIVTTARTIHVKHNSLGLRDIEFSLDSSPTIMFLGDSFVWGVDAEADERFTDLLRGQIPGYKILNAGVSGFGTDQEYLLLKRLWPQTRPSIVVLIFCTDNDRSDNSANIRYNGYHKPYFSTAKDGSLIIEGQPVPKSRQLYIKENWFVQHLWLARAAVSAYVEFRFPKKSVPDPTELLIDKIRQFAETNGARFFVGMQRTDQKLIDHLLEAHVQFVSFDGTPSYSEDFGSHWTPQGQRMVAARLLKLIVDSHQTN